MAKTDKTARGNASQFFVAGELCRRGYSAVVTLGNTPNTDVLCSNREGTKFVHVQVKTFVPGKSKTCSVGRKAEKHFGPSFFWVLAGVPEPGSTTPFVYYVVPSAVMARNVSRRARIWLATPGAKGQKHNDSGMRIVSIPPHRKPHAWSVDGYGDKWELIGKRLT